MVALRPDCPVTGYYRTRLVAHGVWCPVHIWHGQPADPVTGELLDRSPRWQATIRGEPYGGDVLDLWFWVSAHPISKAEYDYQVAMHKHATEHEPRLPEAAPKTRIDHHRMPPVF